MKENKNQYNANITKEELKNLGDKENHLRNDLSDDEILKNRKNAVDFLGKDLDISDRTLKNSAQNSIFKDEENQHYSLGSAQNENLEIDNIQNKNQ